MLQENSNYKKCLLSLPETRNRVDQEYQDENLCKYTLIFDLPMYIAIAIVK